MLPVNDICATCLLRICGRCASFEETIKELINSISNHE